ncbi:Centromere-associated protein E, partial [Ooceraea biroi]
ILFRVSYFEIYNEKVNTLEGRNVNSDGAVQLSELNLVDLAGSEKPEKQAATERLKEGCCINSSLSTLAMVIRQLSALSKPNLAI